MFEDLTIDELSLLIPTEAERVKTFRSLADDTQSYLSRAGRSFRFGPNPKGTGNFLSYPTNYPFVPSSILTRWSEWNNGFQSIIDRNPQIRLYEMLSFISEIDSFSSWPDNHLGLRIQNWVDSGVFEPLPFDERAGVITVEFYNELRAVRAKCGGWLHHDGKNVRFVPIKPTIR